MTEIKLLRVLFSIAALAMIAACGRDDMDMTGELELFSISANGAVLVDGASGIAPEVRIVMTFSASLDQRAFEDALEITSVAGLVTPVFSYTNSSSKANIDMVLAGETSYSMTLKAARIGANGQRLKEPVNISFSTRQDDTITSMAPCLNAGDCKRTVELQGSSGPGNFEFYSNYPVYEDRARWKDLTQAVIVVHGLSINPDDYYSYLTNTLEAMALSESTILIAPFFRNSESGPDVFYWSSTGWREGKESQGTNRISSFEVLDALISRLGDTTHFPALDQIIVTGQSSGALFTHLFAAANRSETGFPRIRFDYLVSESQYFYYPDGQRIDAGTGQLFTPANCTGYDIWPLGYQVVPGYVASTGKPVFDEQFVQRRITYILGNGSGTDNSLNTTDCAAALLGSTRFERGEHMFRYMELRYAGMHNHRKVIVPGVTHDGRAVYQSQTFRTLLSELFL